MIFFLLGGTRALPLDDILLGVDIVSDDTGILLQCGLTFRGNGGGWSGPIALASHGGLVDRVFLH